MHHANLILKAIWVSLQMLIAPSMPLFFYLQEQVALITAQSAPSQLGTRWLLKTCLTASTDFFLVQAEICNHLLP